ncbi:MAG TPA: hypothetical protein VGK73_03595, partial [Polyangiaceae bacterium]
MARIPQAIGVAAFVMSLAVARQAPGQSSEEPRTVDPVRGTIKGSTRYIGLGGAFVAIADDTEGV